MTAEKKSAIDILKEKLVSLSQTPADPVALTAYTAGKSVTKYVGGINIEWNEKDHPRDPNNGQFIETPGGFIFGKAQTAEFPLGSDAKKNLSLQPGDVAFKTPTGNVLVSHADDSYTLHTLDGKEHNVPGGSGNTKATEMAQSGQLQKIGENPAVEVKANNLDEAKDKIANPGNYDPEKADLPKAPPAPPKEEANKFPWPEQYGSGAKVEEKQAKEAEKKSTTNENVDGLNKTSADLKLTDTQKEILEGFAKKEAGEGYFYTSSQSAVTALIKKGLLDNNGGLPIPTEAGKKWLKDNGVYTPKESVDAAADLSDELKPYKVSAVNENGESDDFIVHETSLGKALKAADVEAKSKDLTVVSVADKDKIDNGAAPDPKSGEDIYDKGHFGPNQHPGPSFKSGKTQYTAKQIADYQEEHKGAVLGQDGDGNDITSGSWIDLDGKPVLVHASPYGGVTAYRWVSTKQQASNLPKENLLSVNDFPDVKVIEDPTGKPYGKDVPEADAPEGDVSLKHGSIMSQAVTGAIPNTAVKHKVFVEKADKDKTPLSKGFVSGDWVDIEGKPWQVHASPNEGNIAMAKWVSTKQKKSNNTYDFPLSVLDGAVKIDDPTGTDYKPVNKIEAAEKAQVPEESNVVEPVPAPIPEEVLPELQDVLKDFPVKESETLADWEKELLGIPLDEESTVETPDDDSLEDWEKEFLGYPTAPEVPKTVEEAIAEMAESYKSAIKSSGEVQMVADIASGKLSLSPNFEEAAKKAILDLHKDGMLGEGWMEQAGLPLPQKAEPSADGKKKLTDSDFWFVYNKGKLVTSYYKTGPDQWHVDYPGGTADNISENEVQQDFDLPGSGANGDISDIEWTASAALGTPKVAEDPKPVSLADAVEWDVVNSAGDPIGTYVKNPDGTWKFVGSSGYIENKIPEETVQKDFDDVHVSGVYDNLWMPVGEKPTTPAIPEVEKDTSPNVFVHPVSGVTMELEEGDEVYKAKLTENAYIVKKADSATPYHYFNYAGKAYKPKAEQKSFDKNYEKVEDWPGKKAGVSAAEKPEAAEQADDDALDLTDDLWGVAQKGDKITYAVKNSKFGQNGKQYTLVNDPISATGWVWDKDTGGGAAGMDVPQALINNIKDNPGEFDAKFFPYSQNLDQPDNGHANVTSDNSQSEVDVQDTQVSISDQVENAVAGDVMTLVDKSNGDLYIYTKQKDGDWQESFPKDGVFNTHSTSSVKAVANLNGYESTWHGQDYQPEDQQDDSHAPWGGAEAIGDVPETPKKVAPKKAAAAKPGNDDSYTVGATTIDLGPGELVAHVSQYNGDYYVHYKPTKSKYSYHDVYDKNGSKTNNWKLAEASAGQLKKWAKESGGSIVAEKKAVKALKADYSGYEAAAEIPENGYTVYTASSYVNNLPKAIPTSYYGGIAPYTDVPGFDKGWNTLTNEEKLLAISNYKNLSGVGYATMEALGKDADLDKSDKTSISKAKNAFDLIHTIATVAEELANPDTEWTEDEFDSTLATILPKAQKPGVSLGPWVKSYFPIEAIVSELETALTGHKFKKSLTGLDFDIDTASTAELDAYAKSKGFNYLAALPPEYHKQWVLNDLGDPTIQSHTKTQLVSETNKAKVKIGMAEVIGSLSKKGSPTAQLVSVPSIKGAATKALLKNNYSWTATNGMSVSVTNIGPDEWEVTNGQAQPLTFTDSIVQVLINTALESGATNVNESDDFAYGGGSFTAAEGKFVKKFSSHAESLADMSQAELADAMNSPEVSGAKLVGVITPTGMRRFLAMHIAGDEVGKYYFAKNYIPGSDLANHMGNPANTTGKAMVTAFASWVQTTAWGAEYKNTGSIENNAEEFQTYLNETYGETAWITQSQWMDAHPHTLFADAPDSSILTTPDGKPVAAKPANVSDETWTLLSNATSDLDFAPLFAGDPVTEMIEADLDAALGKSAVALKVGIIPPLLGGVPVYLKRLAVWASKQNDAEELRTEVIQGLAAKVKSGEFLDEQTPVWIAPNGSKFPISPGAKVYSADDGYFYVTGPTNPDGSISSGYQFSASGTPQQVNNYSIQNVQNDSSYKVVFTMPDPITWEKAKSENPDFNETIWNFVAQQEDDPKDISTALGSGAVLTAYLKNHSKIQDFPNVYAQHKSLPEHVRSLVANSLHALQNGDMGQKAVLDVIEYKAFKGHYASMQSKGLYDPTAPWLSNLSLGQISADDVIYKWSSDAKSQYVKAFGLSDHGDIPAHLDSLINPPTYYVPKSLPAWGDLQLTDTGKSLGGMHTKQHWVDQDGNEWMTKAFNSDPNAKARVDAEIAAIKIGSLYGFRVPDAEQLNTVPGHNQYAYLQHLKPGPGDFVKTAVSDLSIKQLQQAMEEHVLDWIVSNHDSHSGNLRFDQNGNVFGIDKGQAFKHFPNDKLAVGYLPPENGEKVWFDNFYNALMSGQIDKAKADEVTKHVLRRAQQVSKDKDEEFRAHLEYAFKNRNFWPDQYSSKSAFIDGLVERKHNAFDDFVDFYKSMYAKSPYEWDIDTENLLPPKLDDHTHIAVTEDYAVDVKKAGLYGKAMMFASADLEDAHILMSTAVGPDGKTMLTGEAKIRKDGDTVLSNWLKQHTIESVTGLQPQSYYEPEPEEDEGDPSFMPQNSMWFSALVAGSKTVSSHNKAGDQQYNTGTLETMENVKKQMDAVRSALLDWQEDSATSSKPFSGTIPAVGHLNKVVVELLTMEQHEAFKKMLDTYEDYYQKVIAAKGTTEKISPHFQQFTYTPSKAALDALEAAKKAAGESVPTTVEAFKSAPHGMMLKFANPDAEGGAEYFTKDNAAEGWTAKDGTGVSVKNLVSQVAAYPDAWSVFDPDAEEEAAGQTIEQDVKVGSKVLHVKFMPSSSPNGIIDFETGQLKLKKGETNQFNTGHMYQIDFGNTIIEYRPWDDQAGVALAQKGLLRFYRKDWDGDADSIDEIFDVLRQMGLSLDPADEESMETFYWNHMTQIMKNRADGNTGDRAKVHESLKKAFSDNPNMSSAETLEAYREAWALLIGEERVKNADWKPKFSRVSPHAVSADDEDAFSTGRPFWTRPDVTVADLKKYVKSFPVSGLSDQGDALKIALSGAALSTEERARFYGSVAKSGMSSTSDQSYGSSAVVYMRQNMGSESQSYQVVYHPRVLTRTHNYSFAGDNYGNIANQATESHWDLSKAASHSGGSNETMVKNALSILDDIVILKFYGEDDRQKAIAHYKKLGIEKIHGFPIEEVFVTNFTSQKRKEMEDAIWAAMEAAEKEAAGK